MASRRQIAPPLHATAVALSEFSPAPGCISQLHPVIFEVTIAFEPSNGTTAERITSTSTYLFGGGVTSNDNSGNDFIAPQFGLDPSCFPPTDTMSKYLHGIIYFSPGVCPQSYTQASTISGPDGARWAGCCPLGYSFATHWGAYKIPYCKSTLLFAGQSSYTVIDGTTVPAGLNDTRLGAVVTAVGIDVEWNDLVIAESNGRKSAQEGLSTGAKAGIGVGVGIAAVLAAGLLLWWILRRRKLRAGAGCDDTEVTVGADRAELHAEEKKMDAELGGDRADRPEASELLEAGGRALPSMPELGGSPTDVALFATHPIGEWGKSTAKLEISTVRGEAEQPTPTPAPASQTSDFGPISPYTVTQAYPRLSPVESSPESFGGRSSAPPIAAVSDMMTGVDNRKRLKAELDSIKEEQARLRMEQLARREWQLQEELGRLGN